MYRSHRSYRGVPVRYYRTYSYRPVRYTRTLVPSVENYRHIHARRQGSSLLIIAIVLIGAGMLYVVISGAMGSSRLSATIPATQTIQRVDQNNPGLYDAQFPARTWAPSDCSAAAMTAVLRAYGASVGLIDVLSKEVSLGVISAQQGLLAPDGIDRTADAFGFDTQTPSNSSLADLYSYTDSGKPVIISFPPQTWKGGHILVVAGHDGQGDVRLVDSSSYNMQMMPEKKFLSYWRGFAKVLTPRGAMTMQSSYGKDDVRGAPTITEQKIDSILCDNNSPACGYASRFYDDGIASGINPAYALAFFHHESGYGRFGAAYGNNSIGNERCIPDRPCVGGFARFNDWGDGIDHWYSLIANLYVKQWGRTTVPAILEKYAPSSDGNNTAAYVQAVESDVAAWSQAD